MTRTEQNRGMMEGLGGPVRMEHYDIGGIDPALDDCCRREVESNRRYNAKTATLRRHDVAALAERRRRNLVQLKTTTEEGAAEDGCRCCYDPNSDGGQYRALMELRAERDDEAKENRIEEYSKEDDKEDDDDEEEKKREQEEDKREMKRNNDNLRDATDSDDDDEFDYLLDDDDDLPHDSGIKALEEARRAELEYALLSREVAMQHGYGTHRQLHPARVLKAAGLGNRGSVRDPPQGVVLHLVDPDSRASASLDLYLEEVLSQQYAGTIFLRSGGRSTLLLDAELAQRAFFRHTLEPDRDMPALIAIRDGVVIHTAPLLRGLVDREGDRIVEGAIHDWLSQSGVLIAQAPPMEALCFIRPEEEALMDYMGKAPPPQETPNLAHRFNCGLADCNKTFYHEHVGISTSEQDGLLVSEADVSGSNIS
jgi:hypothetical protein